MTINVLRLNLDMSGAAAVMFAMLPTEVWDDPTKTFMDPSMGAGQLVKEIIKKLREHGHSDENIASRVFGFSNNAFDLRYGLNRHKLIGHFEVANFLEVKMSKKFDVVISNPPYDGGSALHQQFFNMSVEHLVAEGVLVFIQPATPFHNKKKKKKAPEAKMIEHLKFYEVSVRFVGYDVFGSHADGMTDLAITVLKKIASTNQKIQSAIYRNGTSHQNVEIENISMWGFDPKIYASVRDKFLRFIETSGSLFDITIRNGKNNGRHIGAYIQAIRGHPRTDDECTLVSKNPLEWICASEKDSGLSVQITETQFQFFYTYAQTFIARMGLSLTKFGPNLVNGELKTVPLVPLDRHWTDEELAELIGLTAEELEIIRHTLPDYHGLLNKEVAE